MKSYKKLLDITVYITVRNEAHRIEACLSRLSWVKEIIVFDKESTDNTVEICKRLGALVKEVPNTERHTKKIELFKKTGSCKWCLFLTASDLVGDNLKNIIETSIRKPGVKAISLPYLCYYFGNYFPVNPFSKNTKVCLIKRENVSINDKVHQENGFSDKEFLKIPQPKISEHESYVVHLANENILDFYDKFPRYLASEAFSGKDLNIKHIVSLFIKNILNALILRPTYIFGIRGLLYTTAFLSYILARFTVVTTIKLKENNPHLFQSYDEIRNQKIKRI